MTTVARVQCEQVPDAPHATWSNALVIGNEIVMSGMTAHPAGQLSTYDQTMRVLEKIRALVETAGGDIGCITKLVVYVTDIADKTEVGRARQAFFDEHVQAGGVYPCSTLVEVSGLVFPELRVEIEACARLDIARRAAK
ncbi:RidA family protein [Caballeronia sp. BCC1704]|uniref:RidA family protein n=1 Tax=Caballeronia sp. BCC1704 TaxID=2676300 RepID=UPI00158B50E9|nr:RidA family protein [Caballeronia sp. BCC1704]